MEKGQTSIEVVMLTVLVIALAGIVVSKAVATQEAIFPAAGAREAAIGALAESGEKFVLRKTDSLVCGSEVKVWLYIEPEPDLALGTEIASAVEKSVQRVAKDKGVSVSINPLETPKC